MSERTGGNEAEESSISSVDLSAAQADDALLDAISGSHPMIADELGEAELNALLLSWRRDVDSEAMPQLIDTDTAVTTIREATLARKRRDRDNRRRVLVPVAAAAAVLAIAFAGTGLVARDAQPGDALWSLTKVLYADKARSVEAATEVRADFRLVRAAIQSGQLDTARDMLDKAGDKLRSVEDEENRDGLEAQHRELEDKLDPTPEPSDPITPPDSTSSTTTPPSSTTSPSESPSSSTSPPTSSSDPEPSSTPPSSSSSSGEPSSDGLPGISGKSSSEVNSSEGDAGTAGTDSGTDSGATSGG